MGTETNIAVLATLVILAVTIPLFENGPISKKNELESREGMMARYRLPNNTLPRNYQIKIEPRMINDNLTWIGETIVDFEVLEITKILTLHAHKNLRIDEKFTKLVDHDGHEYRPIGHRRDDEVEFLKIEFERNIPAGNYSLSLKYEGVDTGNEDGFFKASYPGNPMVAATSFEGSMARRAFPCWDEPAMKAHFKLSIKHDDNYTAISNMPEIIRIVTEDGKILTIFDTTPLMSTYVFAFVIADYENVSNVHENVTIWASKDLLDKVQHVMNISQKVVNAMETYTGLPFICPRIGSVVVPIYPSTAIEHWGLVTYGEDTMRIHRMINTTTQLDQMNMLIVHELCHAWFGNHVTPMWWNDLWLNEAFAQYCQHLMMDEIYDNWGGLDLFVLYSQIYMPLVPSDDGGIPIRWNPITRDEIDNMFSSTTYEKGAAIVHMFRNVLTDDVFHAGIKKFMAKYSFKAAKTEDLIESFQDAYDENVNVKVPLSVNETMMSWLVQSGYPIVNVTRNYTTGNIKVTQKSAFIDDGLVKKWWIPLNYVTKTNLNFVSTSPSSWISDKEDTVMISGIDKNDWIIFNVRASGYYRVNYDDENWKRIIEYLNTDNYTNIDVRNRAKLINDAKYFSYEKIFWQLTKYLTREVEYLPWAAARCAMRVPEEGLRGTETHKIFQKYILYLMSSLINKIGFETLEDDDHMTKLSKEQLVGWACLLGDSGCAEFSVKKLLRIIENPADNRFHPDNRRPIFCAGLRHLNNTSSQLSVEWALIYDQDLLLRSLGCTENHEIHRNFFLGKIKFNSDVDYSISSAYRDIMISSEENFNFTVDFFMENHQVMREVHDSNGWGCPTDETAKIIAQMVKTKARLEKFKKILELDIMKNETNLKFELLSMAENNVASSDKMVAMFQKLWDEILSNEKNLKTQ